MTQMTQVSLLQQYATRRDAEAFAKLVEQYQRLIFSTCRRKLHNSQDVDDAVQETFLRLAHKAGELHSNIGGWLHRCAVNVSTDMNRRRAARLKHEHAAAAETPAGIENVGVELSELREHLDAALEKLDPEQRELIIQRYFLGRPQVEMAEEIGVSPSTMTRRLEAAIEAMRGHLQAMGSKTVGAVGATAVIATALQAETASAAVPAALTANVMKIGLSGTGAGATATTAAGTVGGGTLLGVGLTKAIVGVAAALVITGGAIVAVVKPRSAAPPPAPAPQAPQALADVAVTFAAPVPLGVAGPPPAWATTQAAAGDAVLQGVIRDGDGKPVPGATVTLQGGGPTQTTKTDAEGRYAFATVRTAAEARIGVNAAGFVELQPWASRDAAIQLTPQSKARRDIVIQRGVKVTVNVKDVTGQGIAGVAVDTNLQGGNYRTQPAERVNTNDLGVAVVTLPVSRNSYVVGASKDDFEPKHVLVTPSDPTKPQDLELVLLPGVSVKGVAICNDGKPAAGWDVSVKPAWWSSNYIPGQVEIDKDGNFTLKNVGSGKYEVTVWRKNSDGGGTSVITAPFTFPPAKQPIRLDLPTPSPGSMLKLAGKVRVVGGRPDYVSISAHEMGGGGYSHGQVRFGDRPRPVPRRAGTRPATAPAPAPPTPPNEGTFSIDGLTAGTYRIQFESPSIETKILENVKVPPTELAEVVEIKVGGKPRLTGTVVDAETKKPITHFAIRVNKTQTLGDGPNYVQEQRWTQIANPEGKFDVELVGPGVYKVQASLEGYAWSWSDEIRIEKSGGKGVVELKVTKGGSLAGRVVDAAGKPVAGAKVIPFSKAQSVAMRAEGRFEGDAGAVTTDADGKFALENLVAGPEKLKVFSKQHAPQIVNKLTVVEGKSSDVPPIKLTAGGAVEGVVYDEFGKPQAGVTLEFQDASGYGGSGDEEAGRLALVTTDADGKYRVEHLAAERWNRQGVTRRVVRPVEGKVAKLDFGGTNKVSGRLVDSKKQPIGGVRIELSVQSPHFGTVMVNGKTDEEGRFAFFGPPRGAYTLYYMQPNEQRSEWTKLREVQVPGDAATDLGEIVNDTGAVVITVAADDPADAKSIRVIMITSDNPNQPWQDTIDRARADAATPNTWRAGSVPAGKFRVSAYSGEGRAQFLARFERKPGEAETKVTLPMPASSATITVTPSAAATTTPTRRIDDLMRLQNDQNTVEQSIGFQDATVKTIKLPPGTYRSIDPTTMRPRADVEPIVLKAGETRAISHTPLPPGAARDTSRLTAQLCFWSSDGVPLIGAAKLVDEAGKPAETAGSGGLGTLFQVAPGKYRATLELPGKPPVTKNVTVAAPKSPGAEESGGGRWAPIHVILD